MIWRSHLTPISNKLAEIKQRIKDKDYDSAIQSLIEIKSELISNARKSNNVKEKKEIIESIKSIDRLINKTEAQSNNELNITHNVVNEIESHKDHQNVKIISENNERSRSSIMDVLQPLSKIIKNQVIIPLFYQQKGALNFHGAFIYGYQLTILVDIIKDFQKEIDFELSIFNSKESDDFKTIFKIPVFKRKTNLERRKLVVLEVNDSDFKRQDVAAMLQQISLHNFNSRNIRIIPLIIYSNMAWEYSWIEQLVGLKPVFIDAPDYEARLVIAYRGLQTKLQEVSEIEHFANVAENMSYSEILSIIFEIKETNNSLSEVIVKFTNTNNGRDNYLKHFRDRFERIKNDLNKLPSIHNEHYDDQIVKKEIEKKTSDESIIMPIDLEMDEIQEEIQLPSLESTQSEKENHQDNIDRIVSAFDEYSIGHGEITFIQGAVFTRYRIPLSRGERINKVTKVINEIKMRLRSPNVRIIAPIENDDAIGIELPNKVRRNVGFKDVNNNQNEFRIPIGIDVNNDVVFLDFTKDPHYIIAGSTGSGKSVNLNVIIAYFLSNKPPTEVSLLLIDPKQVEFNNLTGLSHMITNRALNTIEDIKLGLSELLDIMQERFTLLTSSGYRNIQEYNQSQKPMPYIVCIIDEFATISEDEDIMNYVQKLSQLSRAAGIHLILATQRPSTDIVSGTIKNNFTGRIAFKVASNHDSRTVLFESGAEELIGQGDMLVANSGSTLRRAQGAYISLTELNQIMHTSRLQFKERNSIFLKQVK